MSTDTASFGTLLKTYRKNYEVTRQELATLTGLSLRTLQSYEQGCRLPRSGHRLLLLTLALELTPGEFRALAIAAINTPRKRKIVNRFGDLLHQLCAPVCKV